MASSSGIYEISRLYCIHDVRQNLVRHNVTINFIQNPEHLYVEMSERVVLYARAFRNFKIRDEMVPVVIIRDRIEKCLAVKHSFVKLVQVVGYDIFRMVLFKSALIQNPDFFCMFENCRHIWLGFYGQIAVLPVGVIIKQKRLLCFLNIYLNILLGNLVFLFKLDRIKERAFQDERVEVVGICYSRIAAPEFDSDYFFAERMNEKNAGIIISSE